jgi:hypothetical protein
MTPFGLPSPGRHAKFTFYYGRRAAMKLIAVYVVLVLVGELVAYGVGRAVEHWSEAWSLPVFLTLFFVVLWGAWRLAVRVT